MCQVIARGKGQFRNYLKSAHFTPTTISAALWKYGRRGSYPIVKADIGPIITPFRFCVLNNIRGSVRVIQRARRIPVNCQRLDAAKKLRYVWREWPAGVAIEDPRNTY